MTEYEVIKNSNPSGGSGGKWHIYHTDQKTSICGHMTKNHGWEDSAVKTYKPRKHNIKERIGLGEVCKSCFQKRNTPKHANTVTPKEERGNEPVKGSILNKYRRNNAKKEAKN